jgi:hypothetical protein
MRGGAQRNRWGRRLGAFAAAISFAVPAPAAAAGAAYAPLDQPGPPLTVPLAQLRASLYCQPSVRDAKVEPVLLNPATGVTPTENYSWNWERGLDSLGIPWCAYTAPNDTLNEIATSGEYLVYAIRTEYALAGRRIAILGHSQGGMSMRWPLRFWPDTRSMVDDVIGLAGDNHGTTQVGASCDTGCPPADWEQAYASPFIQALNSGAETFAGISYTEVYTHTDEVVQPDSSPAHCTSCLTTGAGQITNVATQSVCPSDVFEHLAIGTVDPVAYALGIDALTHPGPADPARIPSSVCSEATAPDVDLANAQNYLQITAAAPGLLSTDVGPLATATTGAPVVYGQPALPCYVYARCTGADAPTLSVFAVAGRGRRVYFLVRTLEGTAMVPDPGVTVTLAGHRMRSDADGDGVFRLRLRPGRRYVVSATLRGANPGHATVRIPH